MSRRPRKMRSSSKKQATTVKMETDRTDLLGDLDRDLDPIMSLAERSGLPTGESQELNSQEWVSAALYATETLMGCDAHASVLPGLDEADERSLASSSPCPSFTAYKGLPPALPEDPNEVAQEVATIQNTSAIQEYAKHSTIGRLEKYGEANVSHWGPDLKRYRLLAMNQRGKMDPIHVTDADMRRLSYVPREHALRKGAASLARFRSAYKVLFEHCDDQVSADRFLIFLRRKVNDKTEKFVKTVLKTETIKQMKTKERKVVSENKFLRDRVQRLEQQVVKKADVSAPAGKRRSLRKIKSVPF